LAEALVEKWLLTEVLVLVEMVVVFFDLYYKSMP
jgi:hypothetical protein